MVNKVGVSVRVKSIKTKRLTLRISYSECYLVLGDKCIGSISYSPHNVGYSLFYNEVKRCGYMTEAMEALMRYMRCSKRFSFAFAYANVENEASNRILRKFFGEPYFTQESYGGYKRNLYGVSFK